MSSLSVSINRLQQKFDPDFQFGVQLYKSKKDSKDKESIQSSTTPVPGYQISRADNHMCKFAFEKAVEQLLNYISLIKILDPIANRFIVYRKE